MKILLCHNRYQLRSGEDIAFDFTRDLLRSAGHEILCFEKHNDAVARAGALAKLKIAAGAVYGRGARREAYELSRRERPDVALVQNVFPLMSPSVYYGLKDADVPIIQMVFNYRMLCLNGQFFTQGEICERCSGGNFLHGAARRCFRNSYAHSALYATSLGLHRALGTWEKCVEFFVVPDSFLKNKLAQVGVPEDRLRVVSNPFQVDQYVPAFSPGGYALFVGRLIRPKGVFTLLDASLHGNDVPIVIAGDGEDAPEVRRHPAVLNGRVRLLAPTYGDGFRQLLAGASMVLVPSEWYDNLPMIACQAFACGKPVVASRINGIPEYVKDGENGLLFTPGKAGELAACMRHLFADHALQSKLSQGARRTAETVLSPSTWLGKMNAILDEAAQTRSRQTYSRAV